MSLKDRMADSAPVRAKTSRDADLQREENERRVEELLSSEGEPV